MSIAVCKQIVIPHEIPHKAGEDAEEQPQEQTVVVHMILAPEAASGETDSTVKALRDRPSWLSWFACRVEPVQPAGISVVVEFANAFEPDAISMLSAMRDLSGVPVVVRAAGERSLTDEQRGQLRSLGFTGYEGMGKDAYAFNIATYKETPEWLNPRNWANPELWDKFRW